MAGFQVFKEHRFIILILALSAQINAWAAPKVPLPSTCGTLLVGDSAAIHDGSVQINKDARHLIGFYRDQAGKIKPVYSNAPELASVRNIEEGNLVFSGSGWNPRRVMRQVPLTAKRAVDVRIDGKSREFDLLPSFLKDAFQDGKVFVTAKANESTEFSVLMAVAPNQDGSEGRTGILLHQGEPVTVRKGGKEFLVEIKGVGVPEGGFDYNYKSTRGTIRGGIEASSAFYEFKMNKLDQQTNPEAAENNTVLVVGSVSFEGESGRQASLIRLTPGSIRATFRDNPDLEKEIGESSDLARWFGLTWGSFIARGLIPLSHMENLVAIEGGKRFVMTDYGDIAPIGIFPLDKRSEDRAARDSIAALAEMPGYNHEKHFPKFLAGFVEALQKNGTVKEKTINEIKRAKSTAEVGKIFWDQFLVLEHFRQKSSLGWIPLWFKDIDVKSPDLKPSYFSEDLVRILKDRYEGNKDTISLIQRDVKDGEWGIKDAREELANLSTKAGQDAWKKGLISRQSWVDERHAQSQLESRVAALEDSIAHVLEQKKSQEESIEKYKRNNKGLEETGFTVAGLLNLIQSPEYLAAFKSGIGPDHKYGDIYLGAIAFLHSRLKSHFKKEIEHLEKAKAIASSDERVEIESNLGIARARLREVSELGPYAFHQIIARDPNYWIRMAMLPYHSKSFETDQAVLEREQYEKCLDILLLLKSRGEI